MHWLPLWYMHETQKRCIWSTTKVHVLICITQCSLSLTLFHSPPPPPQPHTHSKWSSVKTSSGYKKKVKMKPKMPCIVQLPRGSEELRVGRNKEKRLKRSFELWQFPTYNMWLTTGCMQTLLLPQWWASWQQVNSVPSWKQLGGGGGGWLPLPPPLPPPPTV